MLWVGQTISELGSRISMFVFPLLAYAITGSVLWAAAAEAAHLLGLVAVLLPAGVFADRTDRRLLMRTASATGALLYTSLVVAALTSGIALPHLLLVAVLTGGGAGLFMPAEVSSVRAVVPDEDLPAALAQNQARQHVAALVGGPLGGALFGLVRWLPFAVDAVTYALSWFLLGRIRTDLSRPAPAESGEPRASMRGSLREGFRFILARPLFRVLMIYSALINLLINAIIFVAILRLIDEGVAPLQIGLVETASGLFGILGAVAAPRLIERFRTGSLTIATAWSWVPLALPLALWSSPLVVAAAISAGIFLNPAGNAGIGAYRMALTPPDLQGRVQSSSQFVAMSIMPLAPVLAGGLLTGLGGTSAVAALGVLTAAAALIPTLSRSVRDVPRPVVWQAELPERSTSSEVSLMVS